jgi:hypothetical protein
MNRDDLRAEMAKPTNHQVPACDWSSRPVTLGQPIPIRPGTGVATTKNCLATKTVGSQPAHFQRFKPRHPPRRQLPPSRQQLRSGLSRRRAVARWPGPRGVAVDRSCSRPRRTELAVDDQTIDDRSERSSQLKVAWNLVPASSLPTANRANPVRIGRGVLDRERDDLLRIPFGHRLDHPSAGKHVAPTATSEPSSPVGDAQGGEAHTQLDALEI